MEKLSFGYFEQKIHSINQLKYYLPDNSEVIILDTVRFAPLVFCGMGIFYNKKTNFELKNNSITIESLGGYGPEETFNFKKIFKININERTISFQKIKILKNNFRYFLKKKFPFFPFLLKLEALIQNYPYNQTFIPLLYLHVFF